MSSHEDEYILTTKILENLNSTNESSSPLVVLLACGPYNPIQQNDVEMFKIAKQYLEDLEEEYKYKVVAGYISPSSEIYVNKKIKNPIPLKQRIDTINSLIDKSPWIEIMTWESLLPQNIRINDNVGHHQVVKRLSEFLNQKNEKVIKSLNGRQLKIMYLCDSDQVFENEKEGVKHLENHGLVIVETYPPDESKEPNCVTKLRELYSDKWNKFKDQVIYIKYNNKDH
ncbi:3947_t:CDS:1 [Scutellospora calospora]|uniref:3947_t:CDS:1 n=1 Tax=Scutellospora calospora TaxID=85575 RepID=A0ACA9L2Y2_9GLOM|nr:3947_t:CDS:1 [Scutellospora calospora]